MEEPIGNEDKEVEPTKGRSELETMTFPWRHERCGSMCQGICPLDAPRQ